MEPRLNEVLRRGPQSSRTGVFIRRGTDTRELVRSPRTERKGHVRQEGSCLEAWKRGVTRNQPSWHLDLGLPASRAVSKSMCVV